MLVYRALIQPIALYKSSKFYLNYVIIKQIFGVFHLKFTFQIFWIKIFIGVMKLLMIHKGYTVSWIAFCTFTKRKLSSHNLRCIMFKALLSISKLRISVPNFPSIPNFGLKWVNRGKSQNFLKYRNFVIEIDFNHY